ncbi:MAG: hypothetical protein R3Y50_02065 [Rikenellaceae bacterium]
MQLVSFDIFDTVVIRKCGKPENIFFLTAKRLFGEDSARVDYFCLWRKSSQRMAIERFRQQNLTIEDIYSSFEADYFDISSNEALAAEKECESENIVCNQQIKRVIEQRRALGDTICFISDMYLDSGFIRGVLEREGCIKSNEKVYISCEFGVTKAVGALYDVVRSELKPTRWVHYGDNRHSDIEKARRKGIKAKYVDTSFTQAEKSVFEHYKHSLNSSEVSILIGWLRSIRLGLDNSSMAELAANFVAPLYVSYVKFVLRRAKEQGIKRLYFLNRDSYILHKIAQKLNCYQDLELRYLFVSRRSLVLPAIEELNDKSFLEVFDKRTLVRKNVDDILDFIKSNRAEFSKLGINFSFNKITSFRQEKEVLDKILRSDFTPILRKRIAEKKSLLDQYFRQEGVADSVKCAFVDVGWLGSTRLMVNAILHSMECEGVEFFYFGVREDVLPISYGKFHTFIKEPLSGLTSLIENYFSVSPFQTVLSYKKEGGVVVSVLKDEANIEYMDMILNSNLKASLQLSEQIKNLSKVVNLDAVLENSSLYMLNILKNLKCDIDISALTKVHYYDSAINGKTTSFVKKMNLLELFKYTFLGERVTAIDSYSIVYTLGRRCSKKAIAINAFVARVKVAILKRIKK